MRKIVIFIILITLFTNNPMIVSSSYEDVLIDDNISGEAYFAQDGESVIYTKKLSECEYTVVKYDFSTKEKTILSSPCAIASFGWSNSLEPVFQNYVTWRDFRNCDSFPYCDDKTDIFVYDLNTRLERKITDSPTFGTFPKIVSHFIGWMNLSDELSGLYLKDLNNNDPPILVYPYLLGYIGQSIDVALNNDKTYFVINEFNNGSAVRIIDCESKAIKTIADSEYIEADAYAIGNHVFYRVYETLDKYGYHNILNASPHKLIDYDIKTGKYSEIAKLGKNLSISVLGSSSKGSFYLLRYDYFDDGVGGGYCARIQDYDPETGIIKDVYKFPKNKYLYFSTGCLNVDRLVYTVSVKIPLTKKSSSDVFLLDLKLGSEEVIANTYENESCPRVYGNKIIYEILHSGSENGDMLVKHELRYVLIK